MSKTIDRQDFALFDLLTFIFAFNLTVRLIRHAIWAGKSVEQLETNFRTSPVGPVRVTRQMRATEALKSRRVS